MGKVEDAQEILAALGLPPAQQTAIAAYTLLALADVGKRTRWADAKRRSMKIHAIKEWVALTYRKVYAENTRETFRRQVLHQLVQARVADLNPEKPGLSTNSPATHYAMTDDALAVIRTFGTKTFMSEAARFIGRHGTLLDLYLAKRQRKLVPVTLPSGQKVLLSPGEHNTLQKAVIEEFAPRFAPGATVLYFGDTAKKHTVLETEKLEELRIPVTKHDKLPDIVLHYAARGWLFLIEAVTSHGPVSAKRKMELEKMLKPCPLSRVYVSAFPDFKTFKKHAGAIAWETEVWIAEMESHLIHFNGDKFLGPTTGSAKPSS